MSINVVEFERQVNDFKRIAAEKINMNKLDEELVSFPQFYQKATEDYGTAKVLCIEKKAEHDRVKAIAYLTLKEAAVNEGKKVTEAHLQQMVETDTTVMDAFKDYLLVKKCFEDLDVLKTSLEKREGCLRALVSLHGQQYFTVGGSN